MPNDQTARGRHARSSLKSTLMCLLRYPCRARRQRRRMLVGAPRTGQRVSACSALPPPVSCGWDGLATTSVETAYLVQQHAPQEPRPHSSGLRHVAALCSCLLVERAATLVRTDCLDRMIPPLAAHASASALLHSLGVSLSPSSSRTSSPQVRSGERYGSPPLCIGCCVYSVYRRQRCASTGCVTSRYLRQRSC